MAVVLAVRNKEAEALNSAQRAVRLAPNNFDAQFVFGRALFGSGDYAGAARTFRLAVALKPTDADAQFFLATALERSGDDESALVAYRQLVKESPQRMEGHLGVGVLLVKKGGASLDEGMKELRTALGINPKSYEARIALGRALVSRGRPADALEHLKVAADLAPNNPEPHYQLSLAYRRLGRKEEAAAESAIVKRIHESRRGGAKPPQSANE
jgi:protein O-GlcNAc transferase